MSYRSISDHLMEHPLVRKAFDYAAAKHDGQNRQSSYRQNIPSISHSIRVAEVLQKTIDNYDPVLVASGLVHDTVEDTGATYADIEDYVDNDVSRLVHEVSVDASIKGSTRRAKQLSSLDGMSLNAKRLKVADRAVNLINFAFDPPPKWTLENKINYFLHGKKIIEKADIPDLKLRQFAQEALQLAERTVLVGIRERLSNNKQAKFKAIEGDISYLIEKAKADLALIPSLYNEDGQPIQRYTNMDKLFEEAVHAQREVSNLVKHMAAMAGFKAIMPETLKSRERADEVVKTRMNGDSRYINDLARVSIICKTLEDVDYVLHMISQSYKNVVIYDRFKNPSATGYRDMKLVLRTDKSHFAEVQIHLESFWNAKQYRGDIIYNELRAISAGEQTPAVKKRKKELYRESAALYDEAAKGHNFPKAEKTSARLMGVGYIEYTKIKKAAELAM